MRHEFIEAAKAVALCSSGVGGDNTTRFRVGAILVHKRTTIISSKYNSYKTHPALIRFDRTFQSLHAEAHVILDVGLERTKDCELYIARVRHDGSLGMAQPCLGMCRKLIVNSYIKRVHYTIADGSVETWNVYKER
jgi:deoxycytidylate deaminase